MINIYLPKNGITNLDNSILKDIVRKLYNTETFNIYYETRTKGRFIKILNSLNNEIYYICLSNPSNDSRNAHLMQFISPTYINFFNDPSVNKKIGIYLIHPDLNDKTDYITFFYRCFLTIGINLLNINSLGLNGIIPFYNYYDLKYARDINRNRNSGNNSTYFTDDDNQISFFGKVFGANAMETFSLLLTLQSITTKKIVYYPVIDNDSNNLSNEQLKILRTKGIVLGETINEISNNNINIDQDERSLRDTPKFHYNLLKKFGEKKCFLCGCEMEHLIIGSHIERVSDIQNSQIYSLEEKKRKIVDGDNGFRLCANHDKMFEYGIIYFEGNKMIINENISGLSKEFINRITFGIRKIYHTSSDDYNILEEGNGNISFKIDEENYTTNMSQYLEIHKNRVNS